MNPKLSNRELEILSLAARGKSNPQIGALLYLTPPTVRDHMGRIFIKLGARNRTEAVVRYLTGYGPGYRVEVVE